MGDNHGVKAAVGEALGAVAAARAPEPEQLDLIGVPMTLDGDVREAIEAAAARSRAGRPKGAQNKATKEIKELCRKMFGYDPMVEGFRWLQHTPETLAVVLGCDRIEAFDRLEAIRRDLMRFFYAPQAPVDDDGKPVPLFQMVVGGHQVTVNGARPPWETGADQVEQNQALSADAAAVSDDAMSDGEVK